MKRAEAWEILSLVGRLIHATPPTIARAQHYWRLTFGAQFVQNKEFKAFVVACLYIAVSERTVLPLAHLASRSQESMEIIAGFAEKVSHSLLEEGTIDYQPYRARDPWFYLQDIMGKVRKLPAPPQLEHVIADFTDKEAKKDGVKHLRTASQKCLALSVDEAVPAS